MKRFHFGLQRTTDWREHQAELEKSELEKLTGKRTQLADSRNEVEKELDTLANNQVGHSVHTAQELHQAALFTRSLFNLDKQLVNEQSKCEQQIVQQQGKCIEADRDHRLLLKLRDTKLLEWQKEFNREIEETAADSWNSRRARETSSSSS
ncbi:MAG: hypothetical protein H7039_04895 [Bryobacteraceae bacterium]|nr:hypothetical protein [Bryobacteraceae bacterium]